MPWMQAQFSIAVLSDVKVLRRLFDRTDRPDPDRDLKNALWTRLDTKFSSHDSRVFKGLHHILQENSKALLLLPALRSA